MLFRKTYVQPEISAPYILLSHNETVLSWILAFLPCPLHIDETDLFQLMIFVPWVESISYTLLLEHPYIHPSCHQLVFRHIEDWCFEVDIHSPPQPFTEVIGKSFVSKSAGLSLPGIALIFNRSNRTCCRSVIWRPVPAEWAQVVRI